MSAVWFLVGAMIGSCVGFFVFAIFSGREDDRCDLADACNWRVR